MALRCLDLAGKVLWGPQAVDTKMSCKDFRELVATALGVPLNRVSLVLDAQVLDGLESLEVKGLDGERDVQILLGEDFSKEIQQIQQAIAEADSRISITPGLSNEEVSYLESRYGFCFPPEFRDFLQAGVPVGGGWPDWHELASGTIPYGFAKDTVAEQIRWNCTPEEPEELYEGDWAPPEEKTFEKAVELATKTYPLIPMRGHRCIVTVPHKSGLPVISMHQCHDNIPYGKNFWEWISRDCKLPEGTVPVEWIEKDQVPWSDVPFWQYWQD